MPDNQAFADVSNSHLMSLAAEGDTNAFRQLAHRLGGAMHRQALQQLNGNAALAEDAVQEALIKLWRGAPRWRPLIVIGTPVESYVRKIVKTCCIDVLRRTPATDVLDDETPAANDAAQDFADRHDVGAAILQLAPRQQQAVREFYMDGQSQRAVAGHMGTTEKSVERLLAKARTRMRRYLTGDVQ